MLNVKGLASTFKSPQLTSRPLPKTSPSGLSCRPLQQTSPADLSSRTSDVVRRISAVPLASAKMFNEHRAAMAPVRSEADDGMPLIGAVCDSRLGLRSFSCHEQKIPDIVRCRGFCKVRGSYLLSHLVGQYHRRW